MCSECVNREWGKERSWLLGIIKEEVVTRIDRISLGKTMNDVTGAFQRLGVKWEGIKEGIS